MLTESFIASTLSPAKPSNSAITGIHLHDFQPIPALRSTFKKSSTNPNCLAVSPTHIFAAQADKAVIHVYSRDRNNQEAVVPFPEKIHSIALSGESDGAGTLILGTEGGRVILWELGTGRQVSTPQNHLHPTSCLAVDPISNFLLSGSADSNINVWSIPSLLSFSGSSAKNGAQDLTFCPLRTLSHRDAVTAIVFGHSFSNNNIAVSASKDNTCIVWDCSNGDALHTFLLPDNPLCLALDPADRALYAGYNNGSVQLIDFYDQKSLYQTLHNEALQSTPTQPPTSSRWSDAALNSAVLCLRVSYDGTILLSGHQDGKIHAWDIGLCKYGKQLADFSASITNLHTLQPNGLPRFSKPTLKLHNVVKPRYESFSNSDYYTAGAPVPSNYTLIAQFTSALPIQGSKGSLVFREALSHSSFPASTLDQSLAEFVSQTSDSSPDLADLAELQAQNASLSSQLATAVERQNSVVALLKEHGKEEWRRQKDEEVKAAKKKRRRLRRTRVAEVNRKKNVREKVEDGDEGREPASEGEEELSSSTDEMLESD